MTPEGETNMKKLHYDKARVQEARELRRRWNKEVLL
jgi:hypothetical protein